MCRICQVDTPKTAMFHYNFKQQKHKPISKLIRLADNIVNREYFVSKIFHAINFHVKQFSDKRSILRIYFHALNFHTSQAVRKYFNNEIFVIYGSSN